MAAGLDANPYPRTVEAAYNEVLFHGPDFQGLREMLGYSDKGMVARIRPAPSPDRWMTEPLRTEWLTDPLALDAGYQMGILWCYEQTGSVCLPASSARYRQYRAGFPADGVTAVLAVQRAESRKLVADVTFLDADGTVVVTMQGCKWTVDRSLLAAFRRESVAGTRR